MRDRFPGGNVTCRSGLQPRMAPDQTGHQGYRCAQSYGVTRAATQLATSEGVAYAMRCCESFNVRCVGFILQERIAFRDYLPIWNVTCRSGS